MVAGVLKGVCHKIFNHYFILSRTHNPSGALYKQVIKYFKFLLLFRCGNDTAEQDWEFALMHFTLSKSLTLKSESLSSLFKKREVIRFDFRRKVQIFEL